MIPLIDTQSLTSGQHIFISKPDCNKCHGEIQSNLNTNHLLLGCNGCHISTNETHVTKIIKCENCHFNPQDIHIISYPNCKECHISHGQLKYDYHNNATFMQTHTCTSCHNVRG